MKKIGLIFLAISLIAVLTACGEGVTTYLEAEKTANDALSAIDQLAQQAEEEYNASVPKEEQIGTAGSNMPLKDRYDDAEYEIKVAFQDWLAKTYGEKVFDARIYVEKIYSYEDEQAIEGLRNLELGLDEVAFDVRYELRPAEGVDINELTVPNGVYDEESGWITDCHRIGVLRPLDGGEIKYEVTNIGTGW